MKTKKGRAIPSPKRRSARKTLPNARFSRKRGSNCEFCGLPQSSCRATVDNISAVGYGYALRGPSLHADRLGPVIGNYHGFMVRVFYP